MLIIIFLIAVGAVFGGSFGYLAGLRRGRSERGLFMLRIRHPARSNRITPGAPTT
jgi:hypothetical protein